MTISEAIEQLNDIDNCYNNISNEDKNAIDMAIKSLEAWQNMIKKIEQFQNEYPTTGKYLHDFIDKHLKGVEK